MHSSNISRTLSVTLAGLGLAFFFLTAQADPENKRCLTREQLLIEPIFSACPPLIDEASVSDNSFIAKLYLNGGPSTYTMRWLGQGYSSETVFTYDEDTGLYDGFCGTYACSIPPGGRVEQEHWEYFVGTLKAEHVGLWVYQELQDGVVAQSRTFDVRELDLSAVSGADQMGVVDQPLAQPLRLKLESFEGTGIEDEVIGWELTGPRGAKRATVSGIGSGSETDAEGLDEAFIHLGSKPGTYSLRLNNRRVTPDSEPTFNFTAIDDIEDTNPVQGHPGVEEGVGDNQGEQCDFVGNPVALSIGNKFQREVDLEAVGLSPIEFVRYHNSLGFVSDSFRNYWTHSYDRRVELPADPLFDPVKVVRPDGRKLNFSWDGTAYQPNPGVYATLEQAAGGWRFTDPDLTVETFDEAGLLVDVTDIRGRVVTATHDAGGRLLRIADNVGGSLDFSYDGSGRLAAVTDQAGRSWSYGYEILGRLAWVDNPDGTRREYHYEDLRHAYALTGITTENGGRYSWYEYDELGRATASYHAGDADRVDVFYETDGGRIVTDPLGNTTVYQTRIENKRGVLESISGPACSEGCGQTDVQVDYDDNLNVTSRTVHGVTTQFGDYDSRGQPGHVIQAAGTPEEKRVEYEYDPAFFNRITRISEPSVYPGEARVTTRTYDFRGNMLSETISGFDPFGEAVSRTVDRSFDGPLGQISSVDGPRVDVSDVTTYEYYANDEAEGFNRARLRAIVDPLGIRIRDGIVYSATGKILTESRPNGVTLNYAYYPGNDRIQSLTESGGGVFNRTQWEYSPAGDVSQLTLDDETGAEIVTQFAYDAARRLVRVDSRITGGVPVTVDQRVRYEFDGAGNIISETWESADTPQDDILISRVFDAYNRIDTITRGGVVEDFDYNPDATLAARTDGRLITTNYGYDAFLRLTTTERLGEITTLEYDTHGQQAAVTDPEGHTTRYWSDDLGNRVRQESPDTGVTTWAYNAAGQVVRETDARGQVTLFSYDAAGRLTDVDRAGTDDDVSYGFDACTFGVGRLCSVTAGWGHTIQYTWNAIGEPDTVTTNEGRVAFTHGPRNSPTSIEYPSGRVVLYLNDSAGLPLEIRLLQPGSPEAILVQEIKYSPLGRPVGWLFANGLQTTAELDDRHRPVVLDVPGVMAWHAEVYDANDNLLELTTGAVTHSFGYDLQDRLTAATFPARELVYSYDAVGNRLSRVVDGAAEVGSYEAGSNRILGFGNRQYTLDPNGNTTGMSIDFVPDRSYVYSAHNRLLEVIDDGSSTTLADYRYDGLGQRVRKTTASGIRNFVYGLNGELLAELDGAGKVLHEFVYLDGRPIVDLHELPDAPPAAAPGEVVIDDDAATVYGANWQTKSSAYAVNGSYLQNRRREGRSVLWAIDQPGFAGGPHDVFVKWLQPPGDGISTRYNVHVAGQPGQRVVVDHSLHNLGDWVLLGNFEFAPAGDSPTQFVTLTGFDNDFGFEGAFLEADAVKVVPTSLPSSEFDPVFIHGDHLGTPQFATDQNGAVIWAASYLPFGEATVDEDPDGDGTSYTLDIRFPGQYYDSESGLYYNYFRTYNPALGRYLESDPIGLTGGFNTYAYVSNNPLQFIDPFGLAYFAKRALRGLPWLWLASCNPIDDFFNTEISHEQLFFEDGKSPSNIGFFGDGTLKSEPNPTGYRCRSNKFNDCIMRKALANTGPLPSYCLVGRNCQTWTQRLREEYARLARQPDVQRDCKECAP